MGNSSCCGCEVIENSKNTEIKKQDNNLEKNIDENSKKIEQNNQDRCLQKKANESQVNGEKNQDNSSKKNFIESDEKVDNSLKKREAMKENQNNKLKKEVIEGPNDEKVIPYQNDNLNGFDSSIIKNEEEKNSLKTEDIEGQKTEEIIQYDNLEDFDFPIISKEIIREVEEKIKEATGFEPYGPKEIKLKKNRHKIEGTYIQYNRGCILYAILNNGYIDEKFIPDSMKCYKDHHHKEEANNAQNLLKRAMSVIDLAQLWMNIGGECPYLEIDFEEAKKRIYSFLNEYFDNKGPKTEEMEKDDKIFMEKVFAMTWQSKDYFELLGKLEKYIKKTRFNEISEIKDNACIKNAIDKNYIKERDIIKYGRHCFIFDKILEKEGNKKYFFQDSLAYFRQSIKDKNYNNCDFAVKGYILANEDSKFINLEDSEELEIGLVEITIS